MSAKYNKKTKKYMYHGFYFPYFDKITFYNPFLVFELARCTGNIHFMVNFNLI